jgi:DNA-binding SARP family transcriptional activator/tetratricopeptide (TPR) repeat protein
MRLKLLGPLDLVAGDRMIDVGGPRQRVILSMLGLNANRVTPVEDLIDAVWDDGPPLTARGQIQTCISTLRKLFTDAGHHEIIKTYPAGYLLDTSVASLDIEEFTGLITVAHDLAENDRVAAAAATLRSALGLWRGPALAGVDSRLVRRQAELLEHSRMHAVEERVRLDLTLGWHNEIIGELTALVDQNPLREELYGYLMLALYRSGRQAEALEVYRRAHVTLADELAIEPGRDLRDLERAILNRDPVLDLRDRHVPPVVSGGSAVARQPMVPQLLPASLADFTGRADVVAEICRLSGAPGAGTPYGMPIVAISGRGGVGKSSVAVRAAHELADQFHDGTLYAHLPGADGGDDDTDMLLARFLRALGVSGTLLPGDPVERTDLYRTMLANKRVLVVLDDVTREEQVLPLLPGSPSCTVIVTSRTRLGGLAGATHIEVDVLDVETSVRLLANIIGADRVRAERDATVELVWLCGGLPLALRIAGARLASRPHWHVEGLVRRLAVEARRLDEFTHRGLELRSNIGLTYRALPKRAQHLFRLLALVRAPGFPCWTAAALLDTDLLDAQDLLESLVDARMLDVVTYPGTPAWDRFHDLIQVYARERLAEVDQAEQDAALQRLFGAWLALAEEAHRKEYGGDYTVLRGQAPRWRPPRDDAVPFDDPVEWWDSQRSALVAAVRQAAAAGLDEVCWDLALNSVTLFEIKGYFDHWRETTELSLQVTTRAGNRIGQAAMRYSLGTLHMFQKRLTEAEQCLTEALAGFDAAGHRHGRALVLRNLALIDGVHGDWRAMCARYDDALTLMREVGDRMGEAQVLRSIARFWIDEGDRERACRLLDDALSICDDVGCLRGKAQVLNQFAHLYLADDRIESAKDAAHQVLLIVRELGDRIGEAYALYRLGLVRRREGSLDGAEAALHNALALAGRVGERLVEGESLFALGEIHIAKGDHAVAAEHLAGALMVFEEMASVPWQAKTLILLAQAHLAMHEVTQAAASLRRATDLLSTVDSKEAARLVSEAERIAALTKRTITLPLPEKRLTRR